MFSVRSAAKRASAPMAPVTAPEPVAKPMNRGGDTVTRLAGAATTAAPLAKRSPLAWRGRKGGFGGRLTAGRTAKFI